MSIIDSILEEIAKPRFTYKGVYVNFFGLPTLKSFSRHSVSNVVWGLKRSGYIKKQPTGKWALTRSGRNYIKKRLSNFKKFTSPFPPSAPRRLIVMFDVPEHKKAQREWLRFQLKRFRYIMIQKSVWVGPSPLPKDFLEYLKEVDIMSCVKTFKLARPYKIEDTYKKR